MGDSYNNVLSSFGASQIDNYNKLIKDNVALQNTAISEITSKNAELQKKQMIQLNQLKEIEDKEKLLLTRSRMLQIAQDRNAYKKKIIYSLIAVIFALFIFTIFIYVLYSKKGSNNK